MGIDYYNKINVSGPSLNAFRKYAKEGGEFICNDPSGHSYGSIFYHEEYPKKTKDLRRDCEAHAFEAEDSIEIRLEGKNADLHWNLEALSKLFSDLKFELIDWDDASGSVGFVCYCNGQVKSFESACMDDSVLESFCVDDKNWVNGMYQLGWDTECIIQLIVQGEALDCFSQWLDGKLPDLEKIIPTPEPLITGRLLNDSECKWLRDKYEKELTDWRIENWGTSTNIFEDVNFESPRIEIGKNQITLKFATFETPPKRAIKKLSQMFPELSFALIYRIDWEKERKLILYLNGEACDEVEVTIKHNADYLQLLRHRQESDNA